MTKPAKLHYKNKSGYARRVAKDGREWIRLPIKQAKVFDGGGVFGLCWIDGCNTYDSRMLGIVDFMLPKDSKRRPRWRKGPRWEWVQIKGTYRRQARPFGPKR